MSNIYSLKTELASDAAKEQKHPESKTTEPKDVAMEQTRAALAKVMSSPRKTKIIEDDKCRSVCAVSTVSDKE